MRHDKRKAALVALRAYADEIRTEIERQTRELTTELARVERSIDELSGGLAKGTTPALPGITLSGEYAGLGPQGAVEKFLLSNPGRMFTSKAIALELKSKGFTVSNPKLASQQVMIALLRATKKGLAVESKIENRRAFQLNPTKEERE